MKISDLLKMDGIIEEMRAENKREALTELAARVVQCRLECNMDDMLKVLLDREKLGSTGIGDGIAIPHGKIKGLKEMVIIFGRSGKGIDFDALDNRPAHLFFLLLAQEESAGTHLKALAKISRMLKDKTFRKRLMDARSSAELFSIIREKDCADSSAP